MGSQGSAGGKIGGGEEGREGEGVAPLTSLQINH